MDRGAPRAVKKPPAKPPAADGDPVAAELLAAALRAQSDGVAIASADRATRGLKILFANESFGAMAGRTSKELAGQPIGAMHADKADAAKIARWHRDTRAKVRPLAGEGYLLRPDGSTIYASWSFSPVLGPDGRVAHVVATYRDTTEKRRLQETLVHAQRLDAVGRLAGGVAHDFNNLLSVINGYCEMLAAQVADRPQALREVAEIHKAGLRAATLTRQLLAFGRRQPMDARVTNFNRIVRDNAEIVERLIGPAGRLVLELGKQLGNVRTDPTQFQQVLLNLANNARDALRDKGTVTIGTSNREIKPGQLHRRATDIPPGRYVCLSVADNGTGMDAETQKHLFEPFFTTKAEGKGTGLGLALVYGVVQQSSGFITVRSALLAGSTFEILLPQIDEAEEVASSVPITPLPATRGHELLVLMEEDDVVRKMVAGMLTADGYRVVAARTAKEAARLVREQDRIVELAIVAAESGETLVRELQKKAPELRVLAIGNQGQPAPLAGVAPDRQSALQKPFALSELVRSVRTLLDA